MHVGHFPRAYHTFLARILYIGYCSNFCLHALRVTGVGVGVTVGPVSHVGHMEQHSGSQEAAGLSAGAAAAAAERPRSTVRGYGQTRKMLAGQQLTVVFVIK